jgi:hypothetical protein
MSNLKFQTQIFLYPDLYLELITLPHALPDWLVLSIKTALGSIGRHSSSKNALGSILITRACAALASTSTEFSGLITSSRGPSSTNRVPVRQQFKLVR